MVRQLFEPDDFIEIYVRCSIQECERRDPKGLYKKARNGDIPHFTGISAPYDVPISPSFIIDTEQWSIEEAVQEIVQHLEQIGALQLPLPQNSCCSLILGQYTNHQHERRAHRGAPLYVNPLLVIPSINEYREEDTHALPSRLNVL